MEPPCPTSSLAASCAGGSVGEDRGSGGVSARGIETAGASSQGSKASGSPRNSIGVSAASPGSAADSEESAPSPSMPESAPSLSGGLICASASAFRSGVGTGSVPALPPQGVAGSRPATSAKLSTRSAEGSSTSCGAISRVISAKENPWAACAGATVASAAAAVDEFVGPAAAAGMAAACRWSCHQPFSEASPPVSSWIRGGRASTPWRCTQRSDSQATAPSSLRSRAPFSTRRSESRFCWGRGRTGAGREGGGVTAGLS